MNSFRFFFIFAFFTICISCTKKYHSFVSHYNFANKTSIPDYNNPDYWAAHPWKCNPSDSIPPALRNEKKDSLADVFFIYPTTYTGNKLGWNADINDNYLNEKTDYTSILYQASAFNQHCRIFAPRYRQAHLSAFFVDNAESKTAFDTAYADIKKAFEFYLLHYNKNRPIIIAGHSQGAKMCERLLKEFFDGKPLLQKLVVAYIVGWPIPQNIFENIPVCHDSIQINCVCGWRTFRKDYTPSYIKTETPVSYVTNPLSWNTTKDYVSAKKNKGSILKDFDKVVLHTTDAQVHNGILWVNKPRFPGGFLLKTKNYHIGDINLFYMNLRENVEQRIFSYLKNSNP